MLTRLTYSAIAFAVTAVVYQAYVLAVAPFVEPSLEMIGGPRGVTDKEIQRARAAPHQYRAVLAAYFPSDHWSVQQPRIALETKTRELLIVVDDFTPDDNGQIHIDHCAVLYFPGGRGRSGPPPRNAVILEPEEPVVLQMDNSESGGLGGYGEFERGWLPGPIVIRSDMDQPGEADDLLIKTRDLYINEDLIRTAEPVEFRLGNHSGHGRGVEIRMLPSAGASDDSLIGGLSGFEAIEITSDVSVDIAMNRFKGLSGTEREAPATKEGRNSDSDATADQLAAETAVPPPVHVTCTGPFRFEFANYKASFEDDVLVRQLHADDQLDQLSADLLNLYFDRPLPAVADNDVTPTPVRSGSQPTNMQLAWVEAVGLPVRLDAPSHDASVRCGRLMLELSEQRITLELPADLSALNRDVAKAVASGATSANQTAAAPGAQRESLDEVVFSYAGTEVHAPFIQYQHPPQQSSHQIGQFWARGDGWLRSASDARRPSEPIEVDWKDSMKLARYNGQPVLSLYGRPTAKHSAMGVLWADQLHLYLLEQASAEESIGASSQPEKRRPSIKPDRLIAKGKVAVDSAELDAWVNTLAVWFAYPSEELVLSDATGADSEEMLEHSLLVGRSGATRRRYEIHGDVLNLQIVERGGQHDVSKISVDGEVDFLEAPTTHATEPPLRVLAQSVHVEGADAPNAKIEITGPAPPRADRVQINDGAADLAEISVRGSTLWARKLQIRRGESEAWIRSPGQVQLLLDRDLSGAAVATPTPITINWTESMHLDGDLITFLGDVKARTEGGWLHTRRLDARLSEAVRFDGASQDRRPELVEVTCVDGVVCQFEQRDEVGLTSQQLARLQSLVINLQTGDFSGESPRSDALGLLESVHLAPQDNPLASLRTPDGRRLDAANAESPGQKLRHLCVEFAAGLRGNLYRRSATVFGDVKTLYGPIDSWEQRLSMDLGREPGPNEIWISSDQQQVQENPRAATLRARDPNPKQFGPLELAAVGNVVIDGYDPRNGYFTALGQRAVYDQEKTMFVLEGDARGPASVTRQEFIGAAQSNWYARMLKYKLNTGAVVVIQPTGRGQVSDFRRPPETAPPRR